MLDYEIISRTLARDLVPPADWSEVLRGNEKRSTDNRWIVYRVRRHYVRRPVPCVCNLERRLNGSPCPYCELS